MKIKLLTAVLALLLVTMCLLCACSEQVAQTDNGTSDNTSAEQTPSDSQGEVGSGNMITGDVTINSISRYNGTGAIDSHAGDASHSVLELNFREKVLVDSTGLGVSAAYYPRIKKLSDGTYLMTYQNNKTGTSIYYATSEDLRVWTPHGTLFERAGSKWYATADACVLQNGDIIVVTSFNAAYNGDASKNGIAMKRSTDNGLTWSTEQVIYIGTTWEPSVLQLKSGELQVYWTNTHVKGVAPELGGRTDDNSTGTMMIRSFDNGNTWTGDLSKPYSGQIVAQQQTKRGSDGNYYSGQMPVAIQLNNGSIALALEIRAPKAGSTSDTYHLSFAYSSGENSWPESLGDDEQGPSTLARNKILSKAGPYLRQFYSGETILSYHWSGKWYVMLGNGSATSFYTPSEFFEGASIHQWGALEILDNHAVCGVVPMNNNLGIYVGNMYLNHTLTARNSSVTVDGEASEWTDTDQAFFVGSATQAQTSIRVKQDADNLYFYAETLDYYVSSDDKVAFYLATDTLGTSYINVSVSADGTILVKNKSNKTIDDHGAEAKVILNGTVDVYTDRDKGYTIELKVPKSLVGDPAALQLFNPTLYNKDKKSEKSVSDTVGSLSITEAAKWLRIILAQ